MNHPLSANISVLMRAGPVLQMLDARPGEKILDVGCGLGYNLLKIKDSGAELHGIDIAADSLEYVAEHITPHVKEASCEQIPYPDDFFDSLLFCEVIEHLDDEGPTLQEIKRVLKPGGKLIVTTPALEGCRSRSKLKMLGHHHGGERHARDGYYMHELTSLLEQHGFQVTEKKIGMFLLSELIMEATKLGYFFKKKEFETQRDICAVQNTLLFKLLKAMLVVLVPLCKIEDAIMVPIFRRGHTLVVSAHS